MDDLTLPVIYKGEEHNFPLKVTPSAYTWRIIVLIGTTELIFERDEEGELRALVTPEALQSAKSIELPDPELIKAVATSLHAIFS